MKKELKEKLTQGAMIAAMVTPPYNLICWTIAGALALLRRGNDERHAAAEIFYAPIFLPLYPFQALKDWRYGNYIKRQTERYSPPGRMLDERMKAAGIPVDGWSAFDTGVFLRVKPETPEQEQAVRDIYADVCKYWLARGYSLEELCVHAQPVELLDRAWADKHGFDTWADITLTSPCVDCGQRSGHKAEFGPTKRAETEAVMADWVDVLHFADGSERDCGGHCCSTCQTKAGAVNRSAYFNRRNDE